MSVNRALSTNKVAKKKRLRRTPGVTIKTINQRVYPWLDDVERHVERLGYRATTRTKAREFARQYREQQALGCVDDFEPPCTSCRDLTIWYCSVSGFECKQFRTYCAAQLKKEAR